MVLPIGGRRLVALRHFSTISRILIKHGLGELAHRVFGNGRSQKTDNHGGWPEAQRIRRVLEELGPTFIKMGQLMSTRADMLPPEYVQELRKLQDHVPPLPYNQILPVIERGLGQKWDAVFSSIEPQAMAAASVAQVHRARLKSGEQVAIKIVRPGIEKRIAKDLQLMRYAARKLEDKYETARALGAANLVAEFERIIYRELDMQLEAGHIERFTHDFADNEEIYIPKVYWALSSRSVLVMEHIAGIKMDDLSGMKRHGIDPQQIAMIGLRCFSRQLMEVGFFHADPHPGNVIVMLDGRVSLIDFGIVGYLDEETMLQIANIFLGFAEHDYDLVITAFEAAGLINEKTLASGDFKRDLVELSEPFYGRSLQNISVRDVYDQTMYLVHKYRLRLPRNLLLLLKTLIQTEALGKILGSEASLLEITRPYAKRLIERGYETQKVLKSFVRDFKSTSGYMRGMPKLTYDLLKRFAGGEHKVEIIHGGLDQSTNKVETGLNRLTIGLVVSASVIAASLILNASANVLTFTVNFMGMHTLSVIQLLGLAGYCIATVLGLWLVFSIIRSRRL